MSGTPDLIDAARNGRMFVLVDDEGDATQGTLAIPAQMATPDVISFMAGHARGLICLALTPERVKALGLPAMGARHGAGDGVQFTVSIEAHEGVTTGISAADRARTIAVAIDAGRGAADIVTPGHMFPVIVSPGGVLDRHGHAEAAVDIARLAGLNASGVICTILNQDGATARLPDLLHFAGRHNIRVGTVRDLMSWRRLHDRTIEKVHEAPFDSQFGGQWHALTYRSRATGDEVLALTKGHVADAQRVPVHIHNLNLFAESLGEVGTGTGRLALTMQSLAKAGTGVVLIPAWQNASPVLTMMLSRAARQASKTPAADRAGEHGTSAQILADMRIDKIVLLGDDAGQRAALEGYGVSVMSDL
ncbi:3,4-dihydroxy-2-butanone-4-phosphate synthase [soil metagenome]